MPVLLFPHEGLSWHPTPSVCHLLSAPGSDPVNHINVRVWERNKLRPALIMLKSQAWVTQIWARNHVILSLFLGCLLLLFLNCDLEGRQLGDKQGCKSVCALAKAWPNTVWQPCLTGALMSVLERVNILEKMSEPDPNHTHPHKFN